MKTVKRFVAKMCHTANCCPTICVDESVGKKSSKRVVVTDDHGSEVRVSARQMRALAKLALDGKFKNL